MRWRTAHGLAAITLGALLPSCTGGQTGDSGVNGSCQDEDSRKAITLDAADAAGYSASRAVAELIEGRDGEGEELWLTAPPSWWLDQGASPPADRSLPARLRVATGDAHEVQICGDEHLQIAVTVELSTEAPAVSLRAAGAMNLRRGELPLRGLSTAVLATSDGAPVCVLSNGAPERDPLACQELVGSSRCLDAAERIALTTLSDLFPPAAELTTAINALGAVSLRCNDGSNAQVTLELEAPSSYCPQLAEPARAPVLLIAEFVGVTMDMSRASFWLSWREGLKCPATDCLFSGSCAPLPVESDGAGGCARVAIGSMPTLSAELSVEVVYDEEGQLNAVIVARGAHAVDGSEVTCRGRALL